jgi:hypothetical protein
MRLTTRDLRLLNWIGEQLVVNKCELTELLILDAERHDINLGQHVRNGLISRWRKHGWIETFHELQRGSHLYLTGKGIQVAGLTFKAKTPGRSAFSHLTHHDCVNRLRLYLERETFQVGQNLVWLSERRLMQMEREKGGEYVFETRTHRPDGIILRDDGQQIAIEVERTYKRPKRLQAILNQYLYHPHYVQVRYYVRDTKIEQNVGRALRAVLYDTPLMHQTELQEKVQIQRLPFDDQS